MKRVSTPRIQPKIDLSAISNKLVWIIFDDVELIFCAIPDGGKDMVFDAIVSPQNSTSDNLSPIFLWL